MNHIDESEMNEQHLDALDEPMDEQTLRELEMDTMQYVKPELGVDPFPYDYENEQYLSEFELSEDGSNSVVSNDMPVNHLDPLSVYQQNSMDPSQGLNGFNGSFAQGEALHNGGECDGYSTLNAHSMQGHSNPMSNDNGTHNGNLGNHSNSMSNHGGTGAHMGSGMPPTGASMAGASMGGTSLAGGVHPVHTRPFQNLTFDPETYNSSYDWMSLLMNQKEPTGEEKFVRKKDRSELAISKLHFGLGLEGLNVFRKSNEDLETYARFLSPELNSTLPFDIEINEFPERSRVETQIKCTLKIIQRSNKAPVPHTLLHLPSRVVSRPRYQLKDELLLRQDQSLAKNTLWMSVDGIDPRVPTQQLYMCSKCMVREKKRAYRKRNMDFQEDRFWDDCVERGIVLINGKQVMPIDEDGVVDLPLRVGCYCRHHAVKDGFELVFTLRDCNNNVVAVKKSTPVLISDSNRETRRTSSVSSIDSSTESSSSVNSGFIKRSASNASNVSSVSNASSVSHTSNASHASNTSHASHTSNAATNHPYKRPRALAQRSARNSHTAIPRSIPSWVDSVSSATNLMPQSAIEETPPPVEDSLTPVVLRAIPPSGSVRGGIEVTLLGENFVPNLVAKFGENRAVSTQFWSNSTIIAHLPPSTQAGVVPITFEGVNTRSAMPAANFTYINDGDGKLKELALQMIGYKMSGQIEEAGDVAQKIVVRDEKYTDDTNHQIFDDANGINNMSNSAYSVPDNAESLALWVLDNLDNIQSDRFANVNLRNSEGQTMIHIAAMLGYASVVTALISRGAYVDIQDVSGMTPLHFAVMFGNRNITRMLLLSDADPFHRTLIGQTALDLADDTVRDLLPENPRTWYGELNRRGSSISLSRRSLQAKTELRAQPEFTGFTDQSSSSLLTSATTVRGGTSSALHSPPSYQRLFPDDEIRQRKLVDTTIDKETTTLAGTRTGTGKSEYSGYLTGSNSAGSLLNNALLTKSKWLSNLSPKHTDLSNDKMLFTFWAPLLLVTLLGIIAIYVVRYDGGKLKPLITFGYDYLTAVSSKIMNRILPFPNWTNSGIASRRC